MAERRKKVVRLDFMNPLYRDAYIALLDNPDELRIGVGPSSFVAIQDGIISISGGTPSKVHVQSLGFTFAGMIEDVKFPRTLIPSTIATPNPMQSIKPPFLELIPAIQQLVVAGAMIAAR